MNATQQTSPLSTTGPAAFGVIAERFRRAGQPEKAVTLCREGLEKFPDHLSARVTLGWSLLDMGEHQEAFDQLKSVLKRAPDNLAAIRGLAELHERGIGLVFDSLSEQADLDPVAAPESDRVEMAAALDPVMPAALDPVMDAELDPVMPAPLEAAPPRYDEVGDLDPILEPEVPAYEAPPAVVSRFEIEDVIEASETDSMFDLAGLLNSEPEPEPQPEPAAAPDARQPISLFGGAPLALRDDIASERSNELTEWLSRVRERRSNSVSQLMAG
jgi:tetratricopeptide (TPR) repeat protein